MKNRSITPLPPADFTTEMGKYNTLQPFRYWCHKVLPLVYDDSLSYYELLCKVVDYLNKTMEDVETLHDDITNLHSAYEQLQNYVNTYFSSLDVQQEINNKLDEMATDGTLYEIISKYTDPIVSEQNSKIDLLKSRMDTFASLPTGSTSGDAELIDIRVKADGTTATTAGNAVREQVNELKSDLVDLKESTGYDVKFTFDRVTGNADTLMYVKANKTYHLINPNNFNIVVFVKGYSSVNVNLIPLGECDFTPQNDGYIRFYSASKPSGVFYVEVIIGLTKTVNDFIKNTNKKEEEIFSTLDILRNNKRKVYLPKYENTPKPLNDIYYDGFKYYMDMDFELPSNVVYLSPKSGKTGDGSFANPYTNMGYCLDEIISNGVDTTIKVIPSDSYGCEFDYFRTDNFTTKELNGINIAIMPNDEKDRIVWSGAWGGAAFTLYESIYKCNQSSASWRGAFDTSYRDENGVLIPYQKVSSLNECEASKGTFCISDNYIYVNPINTIDTVRCNVNGNPPSFYLNNGSKLYLRNIDLIIQTELPNITGGTACLQVSSTTYENIGRLICDNCNASGAIRKTGASDNGFGFHVYKCGATMINCCSAYHTDDAFDYMHTPSLMDSTSLDNAICIELNCKGYECGNPERTGLNTDIANASTSHNGSRVIRCGCEGWKTKGPIFADVGSARVINYDCSARDSLSLGANGTGFTIQSDSDFDFEGYMWCIDCTADGVLTNSLSVGKSTGGKTNAFVSRMNTFIAPYVNNDSSIITFDSLIN